MQVLCFTHKRNIVLNFNILYSRRYAVLQRSLNLDSYNLKSNKRQKIATETTAHKKHSRSFLFQWITFSSYEAYAAAMNINDKIYSFLKFLIYVFCCVSFILNSYAIFKEYWSNPTIVSTKVEKSSDRLLDIPSILICNESAFKQSNVTPDFLGYKNNTISLEEFLVDVKISFDTQTGVLNITHQSISKNIKTIFTAFHGTCFLIDEKLQV